MAETQNIAEMAEKISSEIFSIFNWEKVGPTNVNWECIVKEHDKERHPSDVVFTYKEPYLSKRTYLNVDLKSYGKHTITSLSIQTALKNLALAIECAQNSKDWADKYKAYDENFIVHGLLFIYNHDGSYDKDFSEQLKFVKRETIRIPKGRKIFVLGPSDISFLASVTANILMERGKKQLPDHSLCKFYYPDLVAKRANSLDNNPATIEMLTSPYIAMKYELDNKRVMRLYYRKSGEKLEEFLYLFDYLFHYQQLQECNEIILYVFKPHKNANSIFEKAKKIYADDNNNTKEVLSILEKVKYKSLIHIIEKFSDVEIGLE